MVFLYSWLYPEDVGNLGLWAEKMLECIVVSKYNAYFKDRKKGVNPTSSLGGRFAYGPKY